MGNAVSYKQGVQGVQGVRESRNMSDQWSEWAPRDLEYCNLLAANDLAALSAKNI
jgi:hypothetical protein